MKGLDATGKEGKQLNSDKTALLRSLRKGMLPHTHDIRPLPRSTHSGNVRAPTSWGQRRLWFIEQLGTGSRANVVSVALRLRGPLDKVSIQRALDELVNRHEALRTVFAIVDGEPFQQILPDGRFPLRHVDLRQVGQERRASDASAEELREASEKFDLLEGPLVRGCLIHLEQNDHLLLLTTHHVISDGWSAGVLVRELGEAYSALRAERKPEFDPLPIQYADYATWERHWLQGEALEIHLSHWRESLRGAPLELDLPGDRARPARQSYRGDHIEFDLGDVLTERLRSFARGRNVTLFMVLYAAWSILLARLSGQDDILIATPAANRLRAEVEGLIGFFVNTLVLRTPLRPGEGIANFLERIKATTVQAYSRQEVPFEKIVEALQPQRSLSRHPLCQCLLVLQNTPESKLAFTDLDVTLEDGVEQPAIFDLVLNVEEHGENLTARVDYATDLFDRDTILRWGNYLRTLLEDLSSGGSERCVDELKLLSDSELRQVIEGFNATQTTYPQEKRVHDLFKEQVERTPGAVAVVYEGDSLTYAELNAKANQLARYLRERGVGPDRLVGICVERSVEMVVGLLGILKAGGAYVPLDPSYPPERLQYMLSDSAPKVLLTQRHLRARLPETAAEIIELDSDWPLVAQRTAGSLEVDGVGLHANHLAYVIYTSGSTGKPKGVMIEHAGLLNYLLWARHAYAVAEGVGSPVASSLSFDATITGLYVPLLCGRTVALVRDGDELAGLETLLREPRAWSLVKISPAHLSLLGQRWQKEMRCEVRAFVIGGETLASSTVKVWQGIAPHVRLINEYGPTETVVGCSFYDVPQEVQEATQIPIGRPIANMRLYILNAYGHPTPIGGIGEIHIAGAGVARGYLNRRDLTAERFVSDPFGGEPGSRMYKTGDLGRWRSDGTLEYLGRNDHQVKIRGFRIELGEIEAQLARHELVKEAVALAREDVPGEKRLVAYVVPEAAGEVSAEVLRAYLKLVLPDYMVPSAYVVLESFPLTPNGKLDRRALPAPEQGTYVNRRYEAPQGEVEEALAGIWQSLLTVERVGRQDNFFELGGHSLLIVQMLQRLRRIGLSTGVRRVFDSPRLMDLAGALTREVVGEVEVPPNLIPPGCQQITPQMLPLVELEAEHIERIERSVPGGARNIQDIYPLAPLQEGILFHHLLDKDGEDIYTRSLVLSFSSRHMLDDFIAALQQVIERHDVLRTAVLWEELPRPMQVVYRQASLPVESLALDPDRDPVTQLTERMMSASARLDLRQAPLVRLDVASTSQGLTCHALFRTHHLVFDNASEEIMLGEIAAYLQRRSGELPQPEPYRNHVAQALVLARTHDDENFFRGKLAEIDEPSAPFGLLDVHGGGREIKETREELEPALAQRVRIQARRHGVSAATMFHSAWSLVVAHTSAREDVVFGSVLLGRLQTSAGAQRVLGMFINTLPLRLRLRGTTAKELVEHTQRELVELLGHEQASLAVAQRCSGIQGQAPLFTTLLNYRHRVAEADPHFGVSDGIAIVSDQSRTNYPITVSVDDLGEGFALGMETDSRIDPQRINGYMRSALQSLVEALEQAPQTPALGLGILPESERRQVLELFNATERVYPSEKLIHELFEEQVERDPQAIAVVYEDRSLTYGELNAKANQLARYLSKRGVGADQLVGLCVERSLEMVVGLLGILKSGAAYVPLDPTYPPERLEYMLQDAAPQVLLTQGRLRGTLPEGRTETTALDEDWDRIEQESTENLSKEWLGLKSTDLAYVIYTSGSTGKPKGAMNEHRALINRLLWMQSAYQLGEGDRVLQKTPFSFDVSVWEFFWTLLAGARLVVARPEVHKDPLELQKLIEDAKITTLHFVPSMLQSFLDQHRAGRCSSLRHVVCSGEELSASLQKKLFQQFPQVRLSNLYGPTEAAIDVTAWECQPDYVGSRVPIGRPIANTQMYVLDHWLQPVPIEVAGEIYIGGAGVGRGYLSRPQLTAERFVSDPFSSDPTARLYRTGDLGRWRSDGALEYLGRNDHQVKIRGFRIELGEIEGQLARHEQVKEAVVLAREDVPGEKRLVAYVVPETAGEASAEVLREYLKPLLPEYMVPSAYVVLESFPLTPNGKLDRRELPAPEQDAYVNRRYEAPQGEVEEALAGIWQFLLKLERVGRQDNFFELGGHSLLIVQMMERLRRIGLSAEVRRVFDSPRLMDLAGALTRQVVGEVEVPPNLIPAGCEQVTPQMLPLVELETEHIERIVRSVPGGARNIQDIYPLAPLQEGILFHHLLNERARDTYILPMLLRVASRDRLEELIAALQAVTDRHDVLRTAVLWEQLPRPVQVVYRQAKLPVQQVSLEADRDPFEQMRERMQPEQQWMDLRQAPLTRLQIAADPHSGQWYALLQLHHLAHDHESIDTTLAEVMACLDGHSDELPEAGSYRTHVAQALAYTKTHDAQSFFRGKLADVQEPTAPFGLLDVLGDGSQVEEAQEELDLELSRRARAQARRLGVSVATLFHAAWSLVLARTSGRDDVVFGTVLLGRLQGSAGAQRTLGMFINTLPLRIKLQGVTARKLVTQTQRELIDLLGHEQASLAMAQRCSGVSGSTPLFSALLNYRHSVSGPQEGWGGAPGIEVLAALERTNYPIVVSVDDLTDGFYLNAQTDRRIAPQRMIRYLQTTLQSLVQALEESSETEVLSLAVLPESERCRVLKEFNATEAPYPSERLIHELFEEQVERDPKAIAVVYDDHSLTYGELNAKANQLARYLKRKGVGPDHLVGICVERSLEMVVGLLGILKSGGAYVPLDPAYPPERLEYMLQDAAPAILLTQESVRKRLRQDTTDVVCFDRHWGQVTHEGVQEVDATDPGLGSRNLAYMIYTSGSTGKPKGVMVEHGNLANLVHWHNHAFGLKGGTRSSSTAGLGFDASTWEIWPTLCSGGCLALAPGRVSVDPQALVQWWRDQTLEVSFLVTPLVEMAYATANANRGVRILLTGGDRLRSWPDSLPAGQALINNYGPTETTVVATSGELRREDGVLHIGRPIANARVYVLDVAMLPVPQGVTGEIYVGGAGVARGYLDRAELTAERFVSDPFGSEPGARMYKTGDLGRWREDGVIEYLGRNDHQVKIRGFRIEPGEIEAQLVRHAQVKEAAVLVREDVPGEKRLVAYVVGRDAAPTVEELRAHLKGMLPEYMVPSAYVVLASLPLTPNGKLDRRALPAPEQGAYLSRQYEAPQGEVEEILARVWQELLGVERVGRQDNFFELGGHSLLIVQMLERLRRVGLSTQVRRAFDSPTLRDLAGALMREAVGQLEVPPNLIPPGCETITPEMLPLVALEPQHIKRIAGTVPGGAANIQDIYPLAPLQEGMLFHHLLDQERGDTYVLPTAFALESREKLEQLIKALQHVIDRHDILRTAVLWENLPRPVQVVYRHATLPIESYTLEPDRSPLEQVEEWMRPERQRLDLRQPPLMRLRIAADPHGPQWYVIMQSHHIGGDTSVGILGSEIISYLKEPSRELPETIPYRNHVAQALAHAHKHDSEAFFRRTLADVTEPTAPFGLLEVHADGSRVLESLDEIDQPMATRIRVQAKRFNVSVATMFHAAWALFVAQTSGRDDVVFGSVLLGRLHGSAGAQRIVGMFINTLPLRLRLGEATAEELIQQTQRELGELLNHEQASLAVAQRCSGIGGSAPLFSTLLNYRQSSPNLEFRNWDGTDGIRMLSSRYWTNYPINLSIDDLENGFGLVSQTDHRIDPTRINGYMKTALHSLVEALERASQTEALRLTIVPERERRHVIRDFNATARAYPSGKLIHELFEEQVERVGDAVAVSYEDQSLSYRALNHRANQLARYLRDQRMGTDRLVAICVQRSLEMVIGLLGILKAGAAYVPLDPTYPPDRLAYMLEDAAPEILLVQRHLKEKLPKTAAHVVVLDEVWSAITKYSADDLRAEALGLGPHNLAYVIYTSGSTGKPKGAMNEHRGVVNRLLWMQDAYRLNEEDRVMQKTPFSFDVSVWEFFWTLLSGARLIMARPEGHRDPSYVRKLIEDTYVTTLHFVPSMLRTFLEQTQLGACPSLQHVVCSGEELSASLRHRCFELLPHAQLSNLYGPTEAAVDVTAWECGSEDEGAQVPIGHPIANVQMYVLDRQKQPVLPGVAGEIYIGGVGVGRGYLNRAGLTAERFVCDPFSSEPGLRMYKTGDLGRWSADGTLEYLGRNDHQVKIRGFRIELGEIEAQLVRHEQVKEAVVVAREDVPGEKRLVAYVVGDRKSAFQSMSGDAPEALRNMVVSEWTKLYEETYGRHDEPDGPSFAGWNSSDTGQPIPQEQMQEWLTHTVDRIKALKPRRVLEIGCGKGLILQHIAPLTSVYVGTDISSEVLAKLARWISPRKELSHVELCCRSATEIQEIPGGPFDTVILNSVVQYFPDVGYLLEVIQGLAAKVISGGKIFIGDVRHLGLLPMFHSTLQLSRAAATVNLEQLRVRIDRAVSQDKELVIGPAFFELLPRHLRHIAGVTIQLKRGWSANELTHYRYDVVIHVGELAEGLRSGEPLQWGKDVHSMAEVEEALREGRWHSVRLMSIPNARLARETAARQAIESRPGTLDVGALRRELHPSSVEDLHPERFWQLAEKYGYHAQVTWGPVTSPGCIEVLLRDEQHHEHRGQVVVSAPSSGIDWSIYANDPQESRYRQQLVPQLRDYLKSFMPEYMLPSAWMVLDQMPLSLHGKLDRRALPAPEGRAEQMGEYIAPATAIETLLADLWAQILRVDQVSVQDNFFELGGHSLLAIKLITKIAEHLTVKLPISAIFKYPTIEQLAKAIESLRLTKGITSHVEHVELESGVL